MNIFLPASIENTLEKRCYIITKYRHHPAMPLIKIENNKLDIVKKLSNLVHSRKAIGFPVVIDFLFDKFDKQYFVKFENLGLLYSKSKIEMTEEATIQLFFCCWSMYLNDIEFDESIKFEFYKLDEPVKVNYSIRNMININIKINNLLVINPISLKNDKIKKPEMYYLLLFLKIFKITPNSKVVRAWGEIDGPNFISFLLFQFGHLINSAFASIKGNWSTKTLSELSHVMPGTPVDFEYNKILYRRAITISDIDIDDYVYIYDFEDKTIQRKHTDSLKLPEKNIFLPIDNQYYINIY